MVEEAGGMVTRMDGEKFTIFDRSVLVSNGVVHEKVDSFLMFLVHMIIRYIKFEFFFFLLLYKI